LSSISISVPFYKRWRKLHPKHRGQVATELMRLAFDTRRSDWGMLRPSGLYKVTVGEYRILVERSEDGLVARSLIKRNDGYKP